MPRTDRQAVRETFEAEFTSQTGDSDDISQAAVEQHIERAARLVDRVADAGAADQPALLRDLETLLAQHFLATQAPRYESQSGAVRSGSYQGDTGEGLKSTHYGQDAISLDPTGTLDEVYGDSADLIVNG
jgi:hypothetical protein